MDETVVAGWVALALLTVLWRIADHYALHSQNTYTMNRSRKWAVILKYAATWTGCSCLVYTFGSVIGPTAQAIVTLLLAVVLLGKLSDHPAFDDHLYRERLTKH